AGSGSSTAAWALAGGVGSGSLAGSNRRGDSGPGKGSRSGMGAASRQQEGRVAGTGFPGAGGRDPSRTALSGLPRGQAGEGGPRTPGQAVRGPGARSPRPILPAPGAVSQPQRLIRPRR